VSLPTKEGKIDLAALVLWLGDAGVTSLLVEGGSRLAASALAEDIVDKAVIFYAPIFLGGSDGVPMCSGPGPELISAGLRLKDIKVAQFGEDVMIAGYLK
jgi:diaminohydroxyphosphoribosylaminopyrimidine deaminase/5-amino-6-(5-phosphoribosylamino)uracil reductase